MGRRGGGVWFVAENRGRKYIIDLEAWVRGQREVAKPQLINKAFVALQAVQPRRMTLINTKKAEKTKEIVDE